MKVHIALVGGQPEPVYYGIIYAKPDRVIFVHSSDERSKELVSRIDSMFPNIESEKKKFDPVNMEDILRKVTAYADSLRDSDVTINISGGTKPWAYYFSNIFGSHSNCKIFYIDQKNTVWNLSDQTTDHVDYDMDTAISLYGNKIDERTDYKSIDDKDLAVVQQVEVLRSANKDMFYALVAKARKQKNVVSWSQGANSLTWSPQTKSFNIELLSGGKKTAQTISSPHAYQLVVNAGWFEYEIASLLVQWERVRDLFLSCKFKYANNSAKNEIDVIADIGNRLLFVECKTQIDSYTDIDKFRSAMRNFSGTSTIGLFVTREPMDDRAKEKCKDNGILTFSVEECKQQSKDVAISLIKKLEDSVNRINAR